jgi:hypothetical protein
MVLDDGIAAWEEESFMTIIRPANQIRRLTFGAVNLEDLAIPVGVPYVMAFDNDSVSGLRPHVAPFAGTSTMRLPKGTHQGPTTLHEVTFG